ncbi:MAG TPA: DUF99 family protein [Archaeoglobus profundus]|nr:DUF99 family protein [Archaeoglobus profundus]
MKYWRFVGFDDSFKDNLAYIVGCITAGTYVEGFMIDRIEVDGFDVTDKIIKLVNSSKFKIQLKCIFLDGITFAGFNIADIVEIHKNTGIPVLVIMRRRPNFKEIENALKKLDEFDRRLSIIKKAGEVIELEGLYVQMVGCNIEDARTYLRVARLKGKIPEALRISHLVASALIHHESKRR